MESSSRWHGHGQTSRQARPTAPRFALAVVGVTLAIALLGVVTTPPILHQLHYNDFGTFYRAASSGHLYGPDPDIPGVGSITAINLNPPHFHLLFRPLTLLPLPQAYIAWLLLTGTAFAIGIWRTAKRVRPMWPWWMWAVLLAWTPLFSLVYTGQITALVFVPLVLAWWADREMRPGAAGAWLGLALSLKPNLVLLLVWWIFRGRWRSLAMAVVAGAAMTVCGAAAFGWGAYIAWFSQLSAKPLPVAIFTCSVWALPARLWLATPHFAHLADWPQLARIATLSLVIPLALGTLIGLWKVRSPDTSWALAVTATLVLMPIGWSYWAWWWVPMAMGLPLSRRTWAALAVCMTIPVALVAPLTKESVLMTMTLGSAPVYGSLVMWASVLRLALAEPAQTPTPAPESSAWHTNAESCQSH